MRDINFFSPYIETKKASKFKKIYYIAGASVVMAALLSFFGWTFFSIHQYQKKIDQDKKFLSSKTEQVKNYELTKKKVEIMNRYYTVFIDYMNQINKTDLVSSSMLTAISDSMPKAVAIKTMGISQEGIILQGTSEDKTQIAEFEYNLKQKAVFTKVFVDAITKQEANAEMGTPETYAFSLKCGIGDVGNNEADK